MKAGYNVDQLRHALMRISGLATHKGWSHLDEEVIGEIEAIARDALGQKHGVWQWRLGWKKWEAGNVKQV